jgi:hypothetical protein
MRLSKKWLVIIVAIVVVVITGYSITGSYQTTQVVTDVLSIPTITPSFPTPVRHIIIIAMENAEYSNVIGNETSTPYQDSLASKYALAAEYYAVSHPSLPNYLSLIAGSTLGVSSDCQPSQCSQSGRSIVDLLNQKGFSWREYAESLPTNCSQSISSDGLYYPKHNPFVYFSDITGNRGSGQVSGYCQSHVIPFSRFATDIANNELPNYAFITPNACDDAHSCSLSTGDRWLASVVPEIINSPEFNSTVLFIVYDEGTSNLGMNGTQGGGHVACIIVSPFVKAGYVSHIQYSHYSLLATIESIYNLGDLRQKDASAPVMQDIFTISFT